MNDQDINSNIGFGSGDGSIFGAGSGFGAGYGDSDGSGSGLGAGSGPPHSITEEVIMNDRFNFEQLEGRYVIVRSYNEGVNAGYVVAATENVIHLREARRMWYHAPQDKDLSWYEGVALSGLRDDSRLSPPVEKIIQENYSVTFCTDKARESIEAFPSNPQS